MPLYVAFSGGSRFSHALDLDRQHDHCMSVSAQDLIVIGDKRAVATAASEFFWLYHKEVILMKTAFPGAALAWLVWDTIIHIDIEVNESPLRVQYQVHIASLLSGSLHMEVNTP